ncbi:MAG: diguanylate cyclase domain-containing protein, partial [Rubrobacteraceae bacterium]
MRGPSRVGWIALALLAAGLFVFARLDLFGQEHWRFDALMAGVIFVAVSLAFVHWRRLKRSERRFRAFVERAADAILITDRSGEIVDANRRACESLGCSREELIGLRITKVGFDPSEEPVTVEMDGGRFSMSIVRDVSERNRAMEELRRSEARNRVILESIPDLVFRYSRDGDYLDLHASNEGKLYAPREDIVGKNLRNVLPPELCGQILDWIAATLDTGEMQVFEYELTVPEGDLHFEARIVPSGPDEVICFARDVTEQSEMSKELRVMEARNRSVLEAIPDVVFRYDRVGTYLDVHVNEDFRLYGSREGFLGQTVGETLPPDVAAKFMRAISETLDTGERSEFEYTITTPKEEFHREARMVGSGSGEVICFVRDIGERREFESKITRLAYLDDLTGLPNRASFMESLENALEEIHSGTSAMVILSLRGFAKVNDSLGREAGDRLLAAVAGHVREFFEGEGEVARFGGDEFAALLRGLSGMEEAREMIEKGQRVYPNMPFLLDELEVFLGADIGVALIEAGDTPDEVVRKASVAHLEAKEQPEADYKVYDRRMGD